MRLDLDSFKTEDRQRLFDICTEKGLSPEDFLTYAIKDLLVFDDGPSAQLLEMAKDPLKVRKTFIEWCICHEHQNYVCSLVFDYESASHRVAVWQPDCDYDLEQDQKIAYDALRDIEGLVNSYNRAEDSNISVSDAVYDVKKYRDKLETFICR